MLEIKELKKGMYVSELDRPWLDSPFLFQGFRITNMQELEQLGNTCKYVYVDPEKSVVPIRSKGVTVRPASPASDKPRPKVKPVVVTPYKADFESEFPKAKQIYLQTLDRVNDFFQDVRVGKALNVKNIKKTVVSVADSVIRNPDALMLLSVLRNRDNESVAHSVNVCTLSLIFGRYLGLDKKQLHELGTGALLHDIGESKVPREILLNHSNQTAEERKLMEDHTLHGVVLLQRIKGLPPSTIEIARDHHERVNGSGYPQNLQGSQLGLFTKMVAIVDVYDSVTSGLYGKPSITSEEALKNMYVWREELFDGNLIENFIQCLGIYPIGSVVELDRGDIGIVISADPAKRLFPRLMLVRDKEREPYEPPTVINLDHFRDKDTSYEIRRVVKPDVFGIDVRNYILQELSLQA